MNFLSNFDFTLSGLLIEAVLNFDITFQKIFFPTISSTSILATSICAPFGFHGKKIRSRNSQDSFESKVSLSADNLTNSEAWFIKDSSHLTIWWFGLIIPIFFHFLMATILWQWRNSLGSKQWFEVVDCVCHCRSETNQDFWLTNWDSADSCFHNSLVETNCKQWRRKMIGWHITKIF